MFLSCASISAQNQAPPATTQQPQQENRRTVFSRSSQDAAPSPTPALAKPDDVTATDAERSAVLITSFDFDVRLLPDQSGLKMLAQIAVKNDSSLPLLKIPLQISSSLEWVAVRTVVSGSIGSVENLPLHVRAIDSDIDHTGRVNEDVIVLQRPLAVGDTIKLETLYAGQITQNAARLERIGTPHDAALHTDWDRIAPDFVALRGFGNTLWHPAAAPPVLLGDGAKLFNAIGAWKQRESHATVRMRVTLEYLGPQPNLTLLGGQRVAVAVPEGSAGVDAEGPRIMTATTQASMLGFAVPTIFIAIREETSRDGLRIFAGIDNSNVEAWHSAAAKAAPLLQRWLGERKRELLVVDLPESGDAPFELDNILFHSLHVTAASLLQIIANAYTPAYFVSPRVWLAQGVPQFIATLETEQSSGRAAALAEMNSARVPLAFAESDKPDAQGEPLISASNEVYYRTKAAYVLWMLRSLMGDDALAKSLQQYRASEDISPEYLEQICAAATHQELGWFFKDWVYRDEGLPALSIAAVHSRAVPPSSYLVEVEVDNRGAAAASVPVTVRAGDATTTERIRVVAKGSAVIRIVTPAKPDSVVVNDGSIPELESPTHEQKLQ